MFNTLRTDVSSYSQQTFQQKPDLNTDDSKQKTNAIYKSKIHAQEFDKEIISSSKPRKLRGQYAKHLPEVKEAALAEVYSGASINQVSKKYGIKYGTLRNWYSHLKTWMKTPIDPNLLYHEFYALQNTKNLTQMLLVNSNST